jgi:hypothetical protein
VHETTVEKMVGCCIGVSLIETPSRLAFRVGTDNRDRKKRLEVLDMTDEVGAVGEWTEETCIAPSACRHVL